MLALLNTLASAFTIQYILPCHRPSPPSIDWYMNLGATSHLGSHSCTLLPAHPLSLLLQILLLVTGHLSPLSAREMCCFLLITVLYIRVMLLFLFTVAKTLFPFGNSSILVVNTCSVKSCHLFRKKHGKLQSIKGAKTLKCQR